MFFLQDNLSELSVEMAHIEHLQTDSLTAMLSYDTICNSYCISVNHLTAELQPSSLRSSSSSNLIVRRARRKIGDRRLLLLPPASGIVCPPNLRLCHPRLLLSDISRPICFLPFMERLKHDNLTV